MGIGGPLIRRCNPEITILVGILIAFSVQFVGCSRATRISGTDWNEIEEVTRGDYRIRTHDGQEYATGLFTKTDSTVVILAVYRDSRRYKVDPIVIPLEDIESINKIKLWKLGTTFS